DALGEIVCAQRDRHCWRVGVVAIVLEQQDRRVCVGRWGTRRSSCAIGQRNQVGVAAAGEVPGGDLLWRRVRAELPDVGYGEAAGGLDLDRLEGILGGDVHPKLIGLGGAGVAVRGGDVGGVNGDVVEAGRDNCPGRHGEDDAVLWAVVSIDRRLDRQATA